MTHCLPPFLLAASGALDPLEHTPLPPQPVDTSFFNSPWRDVLLVIGAALVMALILFLWAYLTRKDRQRHSASSRGRRVIYRTEHHHGSSPHHSHHRHGRRRRREHPDNLPRNPTLAEAGGLPPLRPEDPDPPPSTDPPAVPPQPQAS